jgi:hypothetical protein
MRRIGALHAVAMVAGLFLAAPVLADAIENIINQVTLAQYQSDLRILTGVDPIPGTPPVYLTNRYARGLQVHIAGQWIREQFASLGLDASLDTFETSWGPNVIGELRGTTRPQDVYVICGHYDTVPGSPGCDDNGSGAAAALMAARILSQHQFEGTVRFVAFSGEEEGDVGSSAYAAAARAAGENIVAAINLDMILHPGFDNADPNPDYDLDIRSNSASLSLAEFMAAGFHHYTPIEVQVHPDASGSSDYYSFWQQGYHAIGLAEHTTEELWDGANAEYHQATDTFDNPHLDWDFGLQTVRGSMAGVIGLAGLVPEPSSLMLLLALVVPLARRRKR